MKGLNRFQHLRFPALNGAMKTLTPTLTCFIIRQKSVKVIALISVAVVPC